MSINFKQLLYNISIQSISMEKRHIFEKNVTAFDKQEGFDFIKQGIKNTWIYFALAMGFILCENIIFGTRLWVTYAVLVVVIFYMFIYLIACVYVFYEIKKMKNLVSYLDDRSRFSYLREPYYFFSPKVVVIPLLVMRIAFSIPLIYACFTQDHSSGALFALVFATILFFDILNKYKSIAITQLFIKHPGSENKTVKKHFYFETI